MTDGRQWFCAVQGQPPVGPFSTQQLAAGLQAGQFSPTAVVAEAGSSNWVPITQAVVAAPATASVQQPVSGALGPAPAFVLPTQPVTVSVPPQQPFSGNLAQVVADARTGRIPAHAQVQLQPHTVWLSIDEAIARCPRLQPTKIKQLVPALIGLPLVWLIGHLFVFGVVGAFWVLVLMVAALITSVRLLSGSSRTQSPNEFLAGLKAKPVVWWSVIGVVATLLLVGTTSGTLDLLRERRIVALKGKLQAKPCASKTLTDSERELASDDLKEQLDDAVSRCAIKEEEERARNEAHERETQCSNLAQALDQREALAWGAYGALKLSSEQQGLLERILARRMVSDDLARPPELPCSGSSSEGRIRHTFSEALAGSTGIWTLTAPPNEEVVKLLPPTLPAASTQALQVSTESAVSAALAKSGTQALSSSDEVLTRALDLCAFAHRLAAEPQASCARLEALKTQIAAREEAAAAREKVKADYCDGLSQKCEDHCSRYEGDRADACSDRCPGWLREHGC